MLTPAFDLSQDADFLTVAIRVPYVRVSEFDVYFEGVDFKFYAKPYFLRLTLPGRIVENGSEQGSYDADKGVFTIRLPKETPGQHFEGLNMLTALLAPRKSRTAKPLVEEIGISEVSGEVEDDDDEEFDWEIEQTPYEEASESPLNPQCHYGFGNLRSGVVHRLQDELSDVIDIKDPDFTPAAERRQKRLAAELAKFDPDHYLADYFEDEEIERILKYNPWWTEAYSRLMASLGKSQEQEMHAASVSFSEEEKYQLRKFVNKSYLLDKRALRHVYYSLIDILLAYCYETRVTEGETNVESAWNIRKLSPTLCWFETWTNVHEIVVSFGRRVLCYPLYRHFKLVKKAYSDTIKILQLGKSAILKCLLNIHKIFRENDPAYILNDLYISDYCVWIQKAKCISRELDSKKSSWDLNQCLWDASSFYVGSLKNKKQLSASKVQKVGSSRRSLKGSLPDKGAAGTRTGRARSSSTACPEGRSRVPGSPLCSRAAATLLQPRGRRCRGVGIGGVRGQQHCVVGNRRLRFRTRGAQRWSLRVGEFFGRPLSRTEQHPASC
nr:protein SHQ1 homolog isoform X4 [Oryctolagus cuniculus]